MLRTGIQKIQIKTSNEKNFIGSSRGKIFYKIIGDLIFKNKNCYWFKKN